METRRAAPRKQNDLLSSCVDSRGLARALVGDFEGAIEDFQTVVADDSGFNAESRATRQAWIDELRRGTDPFDEQTLAWLLNRGG